MAYRIRRSTAEDTQTLGRIHAEAWRETYAGFVPIDVIEKVASVERRTEIRHQMFAETTADSAHFLIESDAGDVVGFGDCGPAHKSGVPTHAEIYTIYLLRSAQGNGMGGKLLSTMLAFLSRQGFASAALEAYVQNEQATGFYRRLGGKELARRVTDTGGVKLPTVIYGWSDLSDFKTHGIQP